MRIMHTLATLALLAATSVRAADDGRDRFLSIYRELVETNTELSDGSCTLAAGRVAARLRAAGFPESDLHPFAAAGHDREGGLVAILSASDARLKPMLLLAHIDVVEARRADWKRDPFTLVEEGGYYYGRGSSDDKAMAAIWIDTLIRLRESGARLGRTVKLALTCGEESEGAFNGARWLVQHKRPLIDAAFALNEGGGGQLDADGRPLFLGVEAAEKTRQNYLLTVTEPGGHSSLPGPENGIYRLSAALERIRTYSFPIRLSAVTRSFFEQAADSASPADAGAIRALLADPSDRAAIARVVATPLWNAALHTTCVPTLARAGEASNALPEHASVTINCRILPGESRADVLRTLTGLVDDPKVVVSMPGGEDMPARAVPLDEAVLGPIRAEAARHYPGVPIVLTQVAGATDGAILGNAGIPTYGVPAFYYDADFGHIHGVDERIRVSSVDAGRAYLFDLVSRLAR